jgi:FkbM family methyltransferase
LIRKIELYSKINGLLHKAGFDIRRFPSKGQLMLVKYLANNDVKDCFDVGANIGQYAKGLREIGFKGKIYSFEPQSKPFRQLSKAADRNTRWQVFNIGLGDWDGKSLINISRNSVSSSLLNQSKFLAESAPQTEYISKEEVTIKRLDTFIKEINFANKFFLKIDAQGYESRILEGAANSFKNIYALHLELSCISLYNGEKLFDEMKKYVESKGYYLSSLENGFTDLQNGRLLQAEAIFLKEV